MGFLFGRKVNEDYEPSDELNATPSQFYQRGLIEFDNIKDFVIKYYPRDTLVIPLTADISAIMGLDGWQDNDIIPSDIELDYEVQEAIIEEEDGVPDDIKDQMLKELFRSVYDYRLINPYLVRDDELLPVNLKMLGSKDCKGLIGKICDNIEIIDNKISDLPFGWSERLINICKKKYDSYLRTNKGKVMKTVIWLPLYNIANTDAICITLIDRIDIIIT